MFRMLLGVLVLRAGAAPSIAEEKSPSPRRPQPKQGLARIFSGGTIQIRTFVPDVKKVAQKVKFKWKGVVTEGIRFRQVRVIRQVLYKLDSTKVKATRADGRKVNPKELQNLLKKENPILLSADDNEVDDFYFLLVKKDTLVLVLPTGEANVEERLLEEIP